MSVLSCTGASAMSVLPCTGGSTVSVLPCTGANTVSVLPCTGGSAVCVLPCTGASAVSVLPCTGGRTAEHVLGLVGPSHTGRGLTVCSGPRQYKWAFSPYSEDGPGGPGWSI